MRDQVLISRGSQRISPVVSGRRSKWYVRVLRKSPDDGVAGGGELIARDSPSSLYFGPWFGPKKRLRDQAADLQAGFGKFVPGAPAYKGKQHPLIVLGHPTRHMRRRRVSLEST